MYARILHVVSCFICTMNLFIWCYIIYNVNDFFGCAFISVFFTGCKGWFAFNVMGYVSGCLRNGWWSIQSTDAGSDTDKWEVCYDIGKLWCFAFRAHFPCSQRETGSQDLLGVLQSVQDLLPQCRSQTRLESSAGWVEKQLHDCWCTLLFQECCTKPGRIKLLLLPCQQWTSSAVTFSFNRECADWLVRQHCHINIGQVGLPLLIRAVNARSCLLLLLLPFFCWTLDCSDYIHRSQSWGHSDPAILQPLVPLFRPCTGGQGSADRPVERLDR